MLINQLKNCRIARVSTIPFFVYTQLKEQLETLACAEADVCVITSHDEMSYMISEIQGCHFKPVQIARKINLIADLISVFQLWKLFRKERYHIIHSTTPKAGLVCAIAAKLSGKSICIHTFTGQAWVTMKGFKRFLVKGSDKLIARLNLYSYADSVSQREFLIQNKIVAPNKIKVIGSGSLAGVDTHRFDQNNFSVADKLRIRECWGIGIAVKVVLFIGRINKEKGIFELFDAMNTVLQQAPETILLVVGPFDENTENVVRHYAQQQGVNQIIFTGFQEKPEQFMAISDVLCLPSYREGFGTTAIEAASMSLPVVGTNIYGLADAIVHEETGLLIEPKNSKELSLALKRLLLDEALRIRLGKQARQRVEREFDSKHCSRLLVEEYQYLLNKLTEKHISLVS